MNYAGGWDFQDLKSRVSYSAIDYPNMKDAEIKSQMVSHAGIAVKKQPMIMEKTEKISEKSRDEQKSQTTKAGMQAHGISQLSSITGPGLLEDLNFQVMSMRQSQFQIESN